MRRLSPVAQKYAPIQIPHFCTFPLAASLGRLSIPPEVVCSRPAKPQPLSISPSQSIRVLPVRWSKSTQSQSLPAISQFLTILFSLNRTLKSARFPRSIVNPARPRRYSTVRNTHCFLPTALPNRQLPRLSSLTSDGRTLTVLGQASRLSARPSAPTNHHHHQEAPLVSSRLCRPFFLRTAVPATFLKGDRRP